jgi:hypothetical protein
MRKTPHLDPLRAELGSLKLTQPPPPWRKIAMIAAGGLRAVGFDRQSELLLVVSFSGRGVIDCTTGERVARDDGEYFEDTQFMEAAGVGPLEGQTVRVAGGQGGGLPTSTQDGWSIEVVTREWPEHEVLVLAPFASLFDVLQGKPSRFNKIAEESELRASGFSYTGRTLIVASSSDILIFGRDNLA